MCELLKDSNNFLEKFISVENATSTRYKLGFSLVSSSTKLHHSHLKSIMHSRGPCIFMLHFDLEKYMLQPTTIHKIFEPNSSFHVK